MSKPSIQNFSGMSQSSTISPYRTVPITIRIGPKEIEYCIPRNHVEKWGISQPAFHQGQWLSDVDENTGHVLANYLYLGSYQTLEDMAGIQVSDHAGFKQAALVYIAAEIHGIPGLQALAIQKIEHYGNAMTIMNIIKALEKDFPRLPDKHTWLHDYLDEKVKTVFEVCSVTFARLAMYDGTGDIALSKVLGKTAMDYFNDKVSCLTKKKVSNHKGSEGLDCPPDGGVAGLGDASKKQKEERKKNLTILRLEQNNKEAIARFERQEKEKEKKEKEKKKKGKQPTSAGASTPSGAGVVPVTIPVHDDGGFIHINNTIPGLEWNGGQPPPPERAAFPYFLGATGGSYPGLVSGLTSTTNGDCSNENAGTA